MKHEIIDEGESERLERKAASSMMLGVLLIWILTLSLNVAVLNPVQADSLDLTDLVLEESEEWPSAVVNSVSCSDVDGDGDVEIVTSGTDLRIWCWDGATLTLETTRVIEVNSVFCSDADGDGDVEIITGGADSLRIWYWNGTTLRLEHAILTIALDSVFCSDVDGDSDVEIVGSGMSGEIDGLFIWRWDGSAVTMETSTSTGATSLFCGDVDGDDDVEIVGCAGSQLRVWRWDGATLTLEASSGTISGSMYSVCADDVDADGNIEIVTGGLVVQGPPLPPPQWQYSCQLRVWNSSGTAVTLEISKSWGTKFGQAGPCVYSVFCSDVDDDDDVEILSGGLGYELGELRSWSIKEGSLALENYANWNAIVYSVFCGDVDGDDQTEIVTGGNADTNAQLRIWSIRPRPPLLPLVLETSGCGYTVVSICCDDVDGDGDREIVTGGSYRQAGEPRDYYGQLQIWNWDEATLTQEAYEDWNLGANPASVYSVCADDVDEDGVKEIMTVASKGGYGELRIWNWNGATLTLEKLEWWLNEVSSVCADDVDGDGVKEIITGGYAYDGATYNGQLRIWNWDGTTLTLEKTQEWLVGNTYVYSVCVSDVDGDGAKEIVTGGETSSQGQLRVWNWNGATLTLEVSQEWRVLGNTRVNSMTIDDVDEDGTKEIVTGGVANDGTNNNGQLRVWRWDGITLTLEVSREWASAGLTEVSSVCAGDVDGDSEVEIVSGGAASNATDANAQLRVWRWNEVTLTMEVSKIVWTPSHSYAIHIHSVCTDDVDGDGIVEIETGGSDYGFAKLRIWYVVNMDVAITGVVTSKTILGQGYSMSINVTVENRGNVPMLSFLVTTHYGNVPIGTLTVDNIPPGGSTELTFIWDETTIPKGDYIISAHAIANGDIHDADNHLSDGTVRVTIPCDVNGEGKVDVYDLFEMGKAYGATPAMPNWNPNCDLYEDGMIYTSELSDLSENYGNLLPVG